MIYIGRIRHEQSAGTSVASCLFDPQLRKTCWCKTQGYDHQPNDAQRMKCPVHQVIAADTTQHARKPRGKPGDDKTDPLHKRHQLASNSRLRRVIERQQQTERKRAAQISPDLRITRTTRTEYVSVLVDTVILKSFDGFSFTPLNMKPEAASDICIPFR